MGVGTLESGKLVSRYDDAEALPPGQARQVCLPKSRLESATSR